MPKINLAQVRRQLDELPMLAALAPLFAEPGGSSGAEPTGGSGSDPAQAPLRLEVLDLLDQREKAGARRLGARGRLGLLPALTGWVRVVDEDLDGSEGYETPWRREACCAACQVINVGPSDVQGCCVWSLREHPWPQRTVTGEVDYLLRHLHWIGEQPWADEFADEIDQLNRDLRAAIRWRDPEPLKCIDDQCEWAVVGMDGGTWFRCTGCGRTWSRGEVKRLYERQQPMPLAQCAELLDRPAKTLHHWVQTGWLTHVGRDYRGRLYRYQEVVDCAARVVNGVKTRV